MMSVFLERTKREFLTQNFSIDKPPRPLPQQLKNNQRVVTIENNRKNGILVLRAEDTITTNIYLIFSVFSRECCLQTEFPGDTIYIHYSLA